jgi:hypothetical protein
MSSISSLAYAKSMTILLMLIFEPALGKLECYALLHRYQRRPVDVRLPQALDS